MNDSQIILAIIGVIASLGAATAYFKRSSGVETIKLLQQNIDAYKDAEKLKDTEIIALKVQLKVKDDTITALIQTAKDISRQGS